jgi:hypothetical protein
MAMVSALRERKWCSGRELKKWEENAHEEEECFCLRRNRLPRSLSKKKFPFFLHYAFLLLFTAPALISHVLSILHIPFNVFGFAEVGAFAPISDGIDYFTFSSPSEFYCYFPRSYIPRHIGSH